MKSLEFILAEVKEWSDKAGVDSELSARVYMNGLHKALQEGKSVREAYAKARKQTYDWIKNEEAGV